MLLLSLLTIPSDIFDGLFKNKSTAIELEQSFPTTAAPGTMNQVFPPKNIFIIIQVYS